MKGVENEESNGKIEIRFENLSVEAEVHVGSRAVPTLLNATMNAIEEVLGLVRLSPSKKRVKKILDNVSGVLRPSRMTLLLGPPGSGKSTLLLALAGKLDKKLKLHGKITYCGRKLSEFVPQRTCAYVSQHDVHSGEMTVRETLDFSGHCLGVEGRYEMLATLLRQVKEAGITLDPEIEEYMKVNSMESQKSIVVVNSILKFLGLDICADITVGNEMIRGISGGQMKRVTTGEMLVGPAKAFLMDDISTGLDSSTAFQIVKFMSQVAHVTDGTMLISLLQPTPETFDLFDDIILLSEGQIVYQGPCDKILDFFEFIGFKCPERKGVADFLQEVTSKKDQEQYWADRNQSYRYIPVSEFAQCFRSFYIGQQLTELLKNPYTEVKAYPSALVTEPYGISSWEILKICFSREWLLMKRNWFIYVFKTFQITTISLIILTVFLRTKMKHQTIADGGKYLGVLFFILINIMFNGIAELGMIVLRLPVFYKQRDLLFYPPWAFSLSLSILRIPLSLLESGIMIILTYYTVGFAPGVSRFFKQFLALFCTHQMGLSLFRFIAAVGRTMVVSNTIGTFSLLVVFTLGGFVVAKDDIQPWWIWAYWASPMMYGQNAIAINEFLDDRWSTPNNDPKIDAPTIGKALLKSRSLFVDEYWFWISIGALIGFSLLYNVCFVVALTYLNPLGNSQAVTLDEIAEEKRKEKSSSNKEPISEAIEFSMPVRDVPASANSSVSDANHAPRKGMILPFQPLSLAFDHVNYYVDMPPEMKKQGIGGTHLQLLRNVSGAFRPGVLTALVGSSGAGKTTLMDVLAGRKTKGIVEGTVSVSGYPKNQATFARISGYCEQNDIHSPNVTVYESLVYSAWLRLSPEVQPKTRKMFIDEVMDLVELDRLRDAMVGIPGVDGLSTEQRKRLTIAVELVANPSIIFMDEPTSGLDARAAAIVMRTVRNTVDTGRTVVCTIHQPSIDIFEAFDELLLMKKGGQLIYAGPLGRHSHKLIEYFEAIQGVPKIRDGYNPATWMLEVSSSSVEAQLGQDFAEIYSISALYKRNQELIKELSTPAPESSDLYFPTRYSQTFTTQFMACLWKQYWSYWRNPQYNAVRFFMTIIISVLFGTIFWDDGHKTRKQQDLLNLLGAIYSSVFFLGSINAATVQPVVAIERTIFYREKAAGMYSALAYAFAQVSIEILYLALQAVVYCVPLFALINLPWVAGNFLWFFYFLFMSLVVFTVYGMMAVSLTPNYPIASIVMSFFMILWNLFSGFLISRPQIPIWWRWYYWASPVAWTVYGVVVSQVGENEELVEIPGAPSMPVKMFVKERLGFDYDFLGVVAGIHVVFAFLFTFIFAYGIRVLNFQKR
ncbi:ABC transporter G family member 39-like isoform X2 [Tasmannia lanceolata]